MVNCWYDRIIWICKYGLVVKLCNGFCIFPNGGIVQWWINILAQMVKWWYVEMVKWFNGELIILGRGAIDGDMVKWCSENMVKWRIKVNSKINCMVRFNCHLGCQISSSILSIHPSCHWWWYWQLLGGSTVLSLASYYLHSILSCNIFFLSDG